MLKGRNMAEKTVTISFSQPAYRELKKLQYAIQETSLDDVIRNGLKLLEFMHEQKENGNKVYVGRTQSDNFKGYEVYLHYVK